MIATNKGVREIRIVVEVKRYKPGHLVTAEYVRALLFVAHAENATKAFMTTTSASRLTDDRHISPYTESGFFEPRPREKTFAWLTDLSKKTK